MATPILTQKAAHFIMDLYPGLDGGLEEFDLMPQGLFNENARVVVEGQIFVIKKMTSGRSINRHRYGATLQKILAAKGFSCPAVVENRDGDVITSHANHLWSIQTWAEGSYCPLEIQEGPEGTAIRKEIGTAVGILHSLATEAQKQGMLPPAPDDARLSLSGMLTRVEASGKKLFSGSLLRPSQATKLRLSPYKSPLQKEISRMLPILEQGCRKLATWDPSSHESLSMTSPCHGDINWENLFFQDGKLTAVLDFDNAMEMCPAFDAVAAAAVVCGDKVQYLDAFMTAYSQAGGISIDPVIIPDLRLLKYVRSLLWQVGVVLSGGTGNDEQASKWMAFLSHNIETCL